MAPPDASTLVVNPSVYYEAAKSLVTLASDVGTAFARDLVPVLKTGLGMGGNYHAVTGWNNAYTKHAGDVRSAIVTYARALSHFSDILNIAGYNWDVAEYNANPAEKKGDEPKKPALGTATPLDANALPFIWNPDYDNGPGLVIAPAWQSATPWTGAPNGRADTLAATAAAWDAFAFSTEMSTAPMTLLDVRFSFTGVQAPEVNDIEAALQALENVAQEIGNAAARIAIQTGAHHDRLVDARQQLSAAGPGAFPTHPGAQVTTTTDNTSVKVAVAASLSVIDILNAANTFSITANNTQLFTDFAKSDYQANGFLASDALSNVPKVRSLSELPLLTESGNQGDNTAFIKEWDDIVAWDSPAPKLTAMNLDALNAYGPQMKSWAELAVKYGNEAGVDPRLVLAMVLQEGAPLRSGLGSDFYGQLSGGPSEYKPKSENGAKAGYLWDKARIEATALGIDKHGGDAGNSIGLTNQKGAPFNEVKDKYPDKFKGQNWSDLAGNDDLAIKAAAYNLKMLNEDAASHATPEVRASQPLNQFLGSGYNAGGTVDRSLIVAHGDDEFRSNEVEHGSKSVEVAQLADTILVKSGAYR